MTQLDDVLVAHQPIAVGDDGERVAARLGTTGYDRAIPFSATKGITLRTDVGEHDRKTGGVERAFPIHAV